MELYFCFCNIRTYENRFVFLVFLQFMCKYRDLTEYNLKPVVYCIWFKTDVEKLVQIM